MANGINQGLGTFDPSKTNRALLERANPYRPYSDRLAENLERAGNIPKPTYFGPGDTLGGELLRGLGNLGLFGVDAIVRGSGYAAAPLAATVDALASPTYEAYLRDEIFPAMDTLAGERERQLRQLTLPQRAGPVGASGIIAGGPTYKQTATPADQDAALRSQLAAAQEAGDVYIDENTGQIIGDSTMMRNQMEENDPLMVGGNTFFPSGRPGADETGAVDYDTVSQFINEDKGTSSGGGSGKSGKGATQESADQAGDPLLMTGTAEQDFGTSGSEKEEGENIYASLLKSSTDSVLAALDKAPEGAKTIDEYKQIFSEATGVDISGQPDNSAALTAFGLALMQNKAGKGFNVGQMLSEVGAAGEKALPLMIQAKKDAKASQIAAGRFALTEQSKDAATRTAFITNQVNYLRDRRDKINDDMVARINATEDIRLKAKLKAEGDYQNHLYNRQIKLLELNDKALKGQFKTGDKTTFKPITGMDNLTLTMGVRESDGQPVYKFPAEEAARFGVALADVNDGLRSLDDMSALISSVANQPGGITGQKAIEALNGWSRSLGFDNIYYDPDAKSATPLADADAIKKRVIAQYKRFLSQETGNGISEGDVTRLEDALGNTNWGTNPDVALQRIEETRAIFMGRKNQLTSEIEGFDDRDLYLSEKQYEKTMRGLAGDIDAAYYYDRSGGAGRSAMMSEIFDVTVDADGMQTYRLKRS